MSNGSGLGELLVALSGGSPSHTAEVQTAVTRQAGLLEDARRKRDINLGMQGVSPEAITAAQNDPSQQAGLVASMFHAGIDPKQLSSYQIDQAQLGGLRGADAAIQGLGYTPQQAAAGGTLINANRGANIDNTIQGLMRLQVPVAGTAAVPQAEPSLMHAMGKDTTKVADGVSYNPFGASDQRLAVTPVGVATIAAHNAAAGASNASAARQRAGIGADKASNYDVVDTGDGLVRVNKLDPTDAQPVTLQGAMLHGIHGKGAASDPASDAAVLAQARQRIQSGADPKAVAAYLAGKGYPGVANKLLGNGAADGE